MTPYGKSPSFYPPSPHKFPIPHPIINCTESSFFSLSLFFPTSLGNMIGSGNFGDVHRGVWLTNSEEIEVAVKTLKTRAGKTDKIKFLQEAAIMGQFRHPNVVQMYGVALNREPVSVQFPDSFIEGKILLLGVYVCAHVCMHVKILLVLEFLSRGDLLEQLKLMRSKRMSQVEGDLLNYGCQVACGMKYLSQLGFVHRV